MNGSCATVSALVLNPTEPSGQQLFICRDIGGGTLQWQLINDDAATTAADHTYTDQQVAAEASARTSADNAETSARQAADTTLQSNIDAEVSRAQLAEAAEAAADAADNAEAVTRAAADAAEATARVSGDAASVTSANAYTDSAVTTINNSLATKANLTGGNSFTGDQTVNGSLSLPAVNCRPISIAGLRHCRRRRQQPAHAVPLAGQQHRFPQPVHRDQWQSGAGQRTEDWLRWQDHLRRRSVLLRYAGFPGRGKRHQQS